MIRCFTLAIGIMSALFVNTNVNADVIGAKFSYQQWQTDADSFIGEAKNATVIIPKKESSHNKVQFALEHPFPLIPNFQIARSQYDQSGSVALAQTYRLGQQLYSVASTLAMSAEYTNSDFIMYYELSDNSLFELDLGLQLRHLDAEFTAADASKSLSSATNSKEWRPMGYIKLKSGLPLVGIQSYIQWSQGSDSMEMEAAVGYRIVDSAFADLSVYLGYKDNEVELNNVDGIFAKHEWQAVFVGIELEF